MAFPNPRAAALRNIELAGDEVVNRRMADCRAARHRKDLAAVDPDGILPEAERERLADERHRERLRRAAAASVESRRARKAELEATEARYRALVESLVDNAPKITPEQAAKLTTLLLPVDREGHGTTPAPAYVRTPGR
ncbi:hypothetical protein ABGB07_03740 [Micromonosporaceae bacterium B7E4]